jgi:uncharacterized LabA/DUF88 family protein
MAKGWGRYRWLDLRALVAAFIRDDQTLVAVRYFTARVTHQPEKLARQDLFLHALRAHSGIEPIEGAFEMRRLRCTECGRWYKRPQEKLTDVNIAVRLLADAHEDRLDTAFLLCADGDLVPAVEHVQARGVGIALIDPPRRHSAELAALADRHWHISRAQMNGALLPDTVEHRARNGKVRRYHRPDEWA